jgi:predicted methyltransferase
MLVREKYKYEGQAKIEHDDWAKYFSLSTIGEEYEVLYNTEDGMLIMSDTEYEAITNQEFFENVKKGDKILSIGYGIGFINDRVIEEGAHLTVIEKYPDVVLLDENVNPNVHILYGDVNRFPFKQVFGDEKFDIVYFDSYEETNDPNVIEDLKKLLKPEGKYIRWKHL